MPVAGHEATKVLLHRATLLRERIDWRRDERVKNKPGVDRVELAIALARMESDLARCERELVQRGRVVIRVFTKSDRAGVRPIVNPRSAEAVDLSTERETHG
jgi:hypothetical protein